VHAVNVRAVDVAALVDDGERDPPGALISPPLSGLDSLRPREMRCRRLRGRRGNRRDQNDRDGQPKDERRVTN
jgi:hypothetical protein